MASVFDKILTFLGVREVDEEILDESDDDNRMDVTEPQKKHQSRLRKSNLVSLDGGAKQIRIIVIEPTEFEEVRSYVDHLKNKNPMIVRLMHLDVDEARRIVDFMSGATYAVDGNMRKLGDMIFCFAPNSVAIEGEFDQSIFDLKEIEE